MRANSPSAFFASLLLHAFVAGMLIAFSLYLAQTQSERPPVIFDLVAGPPTAPDELVAPALGNSLTLPKSTTPVKIEEPVAQKPEPVVETIKTPPVEETIPAPPKETPKQKAKEIPKPKEPLAKDAKAIVNEMNRKRMTTYLNEKKKIDRERAKEEAARKAAEARKAANYKPVDVEGIAGGVVGGSTSNKRGGGGGKALTREEADELLVYQTLLKNELKALFDQLKPTGLADSLTADVTFLVAANGEIGNISIARSSGNAEFDQAVKESFRRLVWHNRRPDSRSDTWKLTFRMRDED
jgi:colicin import membrane protein